jgi:integrase
MSEAINKEALMPRPIRGTIDVHTHKDGLRTYYVRMTVDGRRERERLGTDSEGWTPGRALVALEERLEAVRAGTWKRPQQQIVGDDDPTFRMFASSWLEDNMLEWRPSTIRDIKWRLESHLLPHVGEERLSTFDIPRVTAVKTTLLKESRRIAERLEGGVVERDAHNMPLRPLSNESINKCMALLSRILDDAVERGYLRDNPSRRVRRLRHHRPRRPVLEPHEVRAMFEAADRLDRRATGVTDKVLEVAELRRQALPYKEIATRLSISISTAHYRQSRYEQASEPVPFVRIWVRLLCAAGLRIDEACRTRRCDVDLIASCLRVGHAKTPAGVRTVQLTPDSVADLERYLQMTSERPASGLLLPTSNGTPYNRTSAATSIIKPLVAQTNVVLAERKQPALRDGVTAHALRKTYFTFLHEAGAPPRWVADQGGHSDPSTSLRIYTESLRGRERGHHGQAFDDLLNGDSDAGPDPTGPGRGG